MRFNNLRVCRPLKRQGGNTSPSHFNNLLFQLPEKKREKGKLTRHQLDGLQAS